jgi:hypothetical protein
MDVPLYYAVVVEWQTRYLEGVVGVYPWRFESSLPHTDVDKKSRTLCGAFFRVYQYFVQDDLDANLRIYAKFMFHRRSQG